MQAIRAWFDASHDTERGWLAALRDRRIARALAAIHHTPDEAWTVESPARAVGMSRSGFSARFSQRVGESAMRYLRRWRMPLARAAVTERSISPSVLADRLRYQSEAAFWRVFKREFGISPGSLRRTGVAIGGGDL